MDVAWKYLRKQRAHQDWFDENENNITYFIEIKCKTHTAWPNNPNSADKKVAKTEIHVQKRTRQMKNAWWRKKAVELQPLTDKNKTRAFFAATKPVYGLTTHCTASLKTMEDR